MQVSGHIQFFVGTYTDSPSRSIGIALVSLNQQTGELTRLDDFYPVRNPSYLCQTEHALYGVSEISQQEGAKLICLRDGLNHTLPIEGDYPCHLDVSADNRYLAVANYGSGDVIVYLLDSNTGVPEKPVATLYQEGKGPNTDRQGSPHAHQVIFQRNDDVLVNVDLGSDAVHFYRFEQDVFSLQQSVKLTPGCGPRHLVFNKAEDTAYVVCELSETLVVLSKTDDSWHLTAQLDLIPGSSKGEAAAAIKLSADEKFIYVSCRHQNALSGFDVSQNSVKWLGATDCGGAFPRDFAISACNEWAVVANQHSGTLTSFRLNPVTGELESTGHQCHIDAPVCVIELQ
ncbi:6-phosphogluconolactonase [Vibrio tubiashii]|nr:6-phosphogluconolactonase [Vibrio tubiashii]